MLHMKIRLVNLSSGSRALCQLGFPDHRLCLAHLFSHRLRLLSSSKTSSLELRSMGEYIETGSYL